MEPRLRSRHDVEVQRGRDVAASLRDEVLNLRAKGHQVESVHITPQAANYMRAYFASFTQFDGVLPPQVLGVPMWIGGTDPGKDATIRSRPKAH